MTHQGRGARRWVYDQPTGMALDRWLLTQGVAWRDLASGGVFVNGHRVNDPRYALSAGDRVELAAARSPVSPPLLEVLDTRPGLWVVAKPAGMPTEPDRRGSGCVVHCLAEQIGAPAGQLHALGRLDLPVSGLVVMARGAVARQQALRARSEGHWRRFYLGLVSGVAEPPEGAWAGRVDPARRDEAVTLYHTLMVQARGSQRLSLMFFELRTGHKHQVRAHCQRAGVPLLGDRRYGGLGRLTLADGGVISFERIALHAWGLRVLLDDELWSVICGLPSDLCSWWQRFGAEDVTLDSCEPRLATLASIPGARLRSSSGRFPA